MPKRDLSQDLEPPSTVGGPIEPSEDWRFFYVIVGRLVVLAKEALPSVRKSDRADLVDEAFLSLVTKCDGWTSLAERIKADAAILESESTPCTRRSKFLCEAMDSLLEPEIKRQVQNYHRRAENRRTILATDYPIPLEELAHDVSHAHDAVEWRPILNHVLKRVKRMPGGPMLIEATVNDLSVPELAQRWGISEKLVSSRLNQARYRAWKEIGRLYERLLKMPRASVGALA